MTRVVAVTVLVVGLTVVVVGLAMFVKVVFG